LRNREFFIAYVGLFNGSLEINPAWPFGQREGHHSGPRKRVNSFFEKKFKRPVFSLLKKFEFPPQS